MLVQLLYIYLIYPSIFDVLLFYYIIIFNCKFFIYYINFTDLVLLLQYCPSVLKPLKGLLLAYLLCYLVNCYTQNSCYTQSHITDSVG
ncbi:hypothetical protein EB796_011813 [Bugula neritina]|uniref:Uncharacterized protein n=1 Tax=Bugula neritina TaxID=10212 RepID=A0A7J7JWZ5_BUGNE|nr:hypothetical protein EB796_011813 [Bugula neritina]